MRNEDIRNLKESVEAGDYLESEKAFKAAIGMATPNVDALVTNVTVDLSVESHGITWWTDLPVEERILISDYFYQALSAIDTNLIEAKLHLMEWQDAYDHQNRRISDAVCFDERGEICVKLPPFKTPYDHIPHRLQDLHLAGLLRAVGSTLDCLSATIVVVLGLAVKLRKADIAGLVRCLQKIDRNSGTAAEIQAEFYDFFERTKAKSGPEDWLEWADQYRNVFVHRGRRIVFQLLTPRKPSVLDGAGNPVLRSDEVSHLPKYPDRSEIEAFIKAKDVVLNENAELTLRGLLDSTRSFVEAISEELSNIWSRRRQSPELVAQPPEQWIVTAKGCNFIGYSSRSEPLDMDVLVSNPRVRLRMEMGAVDDSQRSFWNGSKFVD